MFLEELHLVKGLDPVADAFASTVYSDIVSLENFGSALFIIYKGVGATGTSTITVEASSDFSATAVAAVPFRYRSVTSTDVPSALTEATTAGFATTAGSSQLYFVEINAEELLASGYKNARLKAVEVVDSPVLGGILVALGKPRFTDAVDVTAIA